MLICACLSIIGTMNAQFIENSSNNGSKTTVARNSQQTLRPVEAPRNVVQTATYDARHRNSNSTILNTYNSSQRGPQATLLTEGFTDITTLPAAGYSFVNASDVVGSTNWFQGNTTVFPAQAGAATSYIGANFNNTAGSVINNFMITPVLNLENGDEIIFWTRTPTGSTFPDRLQVRIDPTGANTDPSGPASVGSYTQLLLEINPTLATGVYPDVWTQFTATVTGLAAPINTRVAFRYWVTNGGPTGANSDYIGIDSLTIEEGATGGGICGTPILEVEQNVDDTCMAMVTQGGLAQSYIPMEAEAAGAGIKFKLIFMGWPSKCWRYNACKWNKPN